MLSISTNENSYAQYDFYINSCIENSHFFFNSNKPNIHINLETDNSVNYAEYKCSYRSMEV